MPGIGHRFTTMVVVVLSSWSCGSTAPSATPEVAAIVVSPATSTLEPNAQLPLRAQVQNGSGELVPDADVTWTVQNPQVVSVSAAGVVKALAVGTSQVAANSLGKSGIAVITVSQPTATVPQTPGNDEPSNTDPGDESSGDDDPGNGGSGDDSGVVANVTVTAPSMELVTGSTIQLDATAQDANGNAVPGQSFIWSSSDTEKATVSASGVVAAKQPGSVTITAQTSSTGGKSGSVRLQIKRK